MVKSNKTDSESKNALIKLVKNLIPGKHNTIPLSLPVAQALGGDLESAIIFSQCMYWSERTDDPDGYFYKCYDEWYEETTIKERTCRDRIKKLESRGWIHTLILHVHNVPKLHIRVLTENFIEDLIESQEVLAKEAEERAEKKKVDLRNRREKRKESSNPYKSTIRQNLPDNSGNSCRIATAEFAGSIDTETTNKNYITETTEYIKGSTDPDSTDILIGNFTRGGSKTRDDGEQSGTASIGKKPDSCGGGETHETQNETELYATPWNPKAEGFRVGSNGWAVMPQATKHKLVRFMTTRGMQLELLQELDEEFSAEWKFNEEEGKYDLWVTTTHARSGWVDDVLGTVKSTGANWIEYNNEDDDYCSPGNASLRVLRNWGYESGAVSQSWYNERLKELWDDSGKFCKQHGSEAKSILGSRPLWECIELELELE